MDYFDWCNVDEMSMIEVQSMAQECGIDPKTVSFNMSKSGPNSCRDLIPIETDIGACRLGSFVDSMESVGVYVEEVNEEGCEYEGDGSGKLRQMVRVSMRRVIMQRRQVMNRRLRVMVKNMRVKVIVLNMRVMVMNMTLRVTVIVKVLMREVMKVRTVRM